MVLARDWVGNIEGVEEIWKNGGLGESSKLASESLGPSLRSWKIRKDLYNVVKL